VYVKYRTVCVLGRSKPRCGT